MSGDLVYDSMLLFELQYGLQFIPQLGDVSINLAYFCLMQVPPPFGQMIDWQLLGCGAADVVG